MPLGAVAVAAFAWGIVQATSSGQDEKQLARRYIAAWQRDDYSRMYSMLDQRSKHRLSEAAFAAAYQRAADIATLTALRRPLVGGPNGRLVPVRIIARTRIFGTLRETLQIPYSSASSGPQVRFDQRLLFPGLRAGEHLHRQVSLAPRAAIFARDGTPLAQGPDRGSPIPSVANQIAGTLGSVPAAQSGYYMAQGYPVSAKVGTDGLEEVFQPRLAGTPGGTLYAGTRVLASTRPTAGQSVTTTIDPTLEQAATAALGSNYAGILAMDPRNGGILAASGIAYSDGQPPGSTMKIITASAALQAGIVSLSTTFPIATSSTVGGYTLQNANGEACGGTFLNAFAVSCNSVFAPLGARLGGARLVSMAERFGFDQPAPFPGALPSTIPSASQIGGDLAVGSSAIGQGKVLATPLEMAEAGATIAMGGKRPQPTLKLHATPQFFGVTSRTVAGEVQRMMVAVVQFGTGTSAQIPGVQVAGKTGTAELRNTAAPGASTAANTDAWFVGYAPVGAPRIVVAALFPNQGAGGQTAAPAVQQVLVAALHAHY